MWGEVERSPVLAAPSFNDYVGLTATSTNLIVGEDDEETQAANDLCKRYVPLARKIASRYQGRGVHYEDLRSAAELGLTLGSRKFDPSKGAFGPYVTFWIKGELTKLFKPTDDAFSRRCVSLSIHHDDDERSHQTRCSGSGADHSARSQCSLKTRAPHHRSQSASRNPNKNRQRAWH